jgi:hypothetical protein
MKTVGLTVVTTPKGKAVEASVLDSAGKPTPGSDGSIEVDPKEDVYWRSCGDDWTGNGTRHFLLRFTRNGKSRWPFFDPKNPGDESLKVPAGPDTKTVIKRNFSSKPDKDWKYSGEVPADATIQKLDPMIIIRGGSRLALIAFAAIGGAVVGALLTYAWLVLRSGACLGG